MIGIDTNVLLRVLLDDDAEPASAARHLLSMQAASSQPVFVNRIVLCETIWTLSRGYRYSRAQIRQAVELLLAAPALRLEDEAAIEEALALFSTSRAGFTGALIGAINRRAGCASTYTFDRRAAETGDFSAVD